MTTFRAVDQAGLLQWAELSGDGNPIHVDPRYAASTRFGSTILHGHLTVAWLMAEAQSVWGTHEWAATGVLSAIRYRRPLRPGIEYQIAARRTDDRTLDLAVLTPEGERAVEATATVRSGGIG